jgi:hypothetical protein
MSEQLFGLFGIGDGLGKISTSSIAKQVSI